MSDNTSIEWCDSTWNPVSGCTEVSPGCDHCYAKTFAERWRGTPGHYFERGFDVQLRPEKLGQPLRWRRPRRIFVNSMSDLFHDEVPDEHIAKVFAVMCHASHHTFQLLTKRHARMRSLLSSDRFRELVFTSTELDPRSPDGTTDILTDYWPLPNVWLGVSTENQQWADIRIPALLDTPAAVRFISAEPLLGPIDLSRWVCNCGSATDDDADHYGCTACTCARYVVDHSDPEPHHPENVDIEDDPNCLAHHPKLGWVIVGGESGPGARPMHPDWARSLRDQCTAAGVPFLFKQRGEWTWSESDQFRVPTKPYTNRVAVMHGNGMTAMTKENPFNPFERGHPHWATRIERVGKKRAGRELDGRTWDEFPEVSGV